MEINVEPKKYYRTAEGRKVGPMAGFSFKYIEGKGGGEDPEWENNGKVVIPGPLEYGDIVAEWPDPIESPIRTVTRRELKDGVYARLAIENRGNGKVHLSFDNQPGRGGEWAEFSADELRSLLMVVSQIVEFLDEDKGDE